MRLRAKYLSIIMVLIIVVMSGCKVNFGSQEEIKDDDKKYDATNNKGESSDAVKDDGKKTAINKNDIDKIEVSFSEEEGKYKRNIIVEPNKDTIKCFYSSTYLDNNQR